MALPLPAGGAGGEQIGAPPPSPTPMGGMNGAAPFSMSGLAPQVSTNRLPPEVLTGITAAAQTVSETLDSFAQITPDKGAEIGVIKDLLQQYLASLMTAGAGATSPTSTGRQFPGGGFDQGIAGAGAV